MAENMTVRIRRERAAACMTCPICNKLLREATTISECLHTFCRKCIKEKLSEEKLKCCPVCNTDLGCTPLEKLRPDHSIQDIRALLFPSRRENQVNAPPEVAPPAILQIVAAEPNKGTGEAAPRESGVSPRTLLDAATARGDKSGPIWFSLVASEDQNSQASLPQIPASYLRIKNGDNLTVSFIQKYLMKKLNLSREDEVELKFLDETLLPTLELASLVDMWLQCAPTSEETMLRTSVGSSAEECLMVLTYNRHVSMQGGV